MGALSARAHPYPPLTSVALHTGDTDPVLGVSSSPLQAVLQLCSQTARPTELLNHPAGVADLLGGQQWLQGPQVALQGLGQRGHWLGGHRGGKTQLLLQRNLQEKRTFSISAEVAQKHLWHAL